MPTRSEIQRMFSRGPAPRSDSRPAAAPPQAQALPPPPAGYAWAKDPAHGFVLVQVALPGPAPAAPARRIVGPTGLPLPSAGPAMTRSSQLLRPGTDRDGNVVDKYSELLARTRDIDPTAQPEFSFLVPDVAETEREFPTPRALHERTDARPDPHQDAWGTSAPKLRIVGSSESTGEAPGG